MRIISGAFKGRRLNPPKNLPVRPTTDKAKESLFNILNNYYFFDELSVLDLFSGTGSISFEFASRGARKITAVDVDFKCVSFIKKTASDFGMPLKAVRANVFSFAATGREKFDLIFADPPYDMKRIEELPDLVFNNSMLADDGLLIIEHSSKTDFSKHPHYKETRIYSKVNFSFFE